MDRMGYLGASDAPVIMGVSPWKNRKELYLEKAGLIEPVDLSDNEAVQTGIAMESKAFPKVKALTGLEFVTLDDKQFPVNGHDFIKVRPDGKCFEVYLLEIKTVSDKVLREYHRNGIPEHYYIQVQTQLAAFPDCEKSLFFAQSRESDNVFIDWVERDPVLIKSIIYKMKEFWEMISQGSFKEDEDQKEKVYLSGHLEPDMAVSLEEYVRSIEHLADKVKSYKEREKTIKETEKQLKELLKEVDGYRSEQLSIDWVSRKTTSLDKRELESFLKSKGLSLKSFQGTSESRYIKIKRNDKTSKSFIP